MKLYLQALISETLAQVSIDLDVAISQLLIFEKKCRLAGDFPSLRLICVHMVTLCRNKEDWDRLNATLTTLNKRRNQSKTAIIGIVETSMGYIGSVIWPSKAVKVAFLETLKEVCAGKMYVEADSARLHLELAHLHEADGDLAAACDMIQDVHVETYGSLSKKEKAEYILEQIRLNLAKKDYIRALIQSRKMNRKILEEEDFVQVKVKYYRMMVEYHRHELDTWEICQCYFKLYEAAKVLGLPLEEATALKSCIVHVFLSKSDSAQVDMMLRIKKVVEKYELPDFASALTMFTTKEIISSSFADQLRSRLFDHVFTIEVDQEVLIPFQKSFRSRVVEHNLRVISTYYTRISTSRLCQLTELSQNDLEQYLSEMFCNKDITVKIDRPAGVVDFTKTKRTETVLSDWSSDIGQLLHTMEATCHLINRENMIYKV